MFKEYDDYKGITIEKLDKILIANRKEDCSAAVFSHKKLKTDVAAVEFDLILAFMFLVNEMAAQGLAMDAYLARALIDIDFKFKSEVMEQFVKFRRNNGIESDEDEVFLKTKDVSVYEIEKCDCVDVSSESLH